MKARQPVKGVLRGEGGGKDAVETRFEFCGEDGEG
jgi:hypothetical protein